ncbi:uncharacterized protein (DUF2249 family)/iron-sulfur cluster repair protein YtfE (RIC family) [Saccharomonospora amisosensis]|uniref:Uncharacterized protein (DUF2249 family)/iron-sulfur cluster repair protein YtfE (RIC family) n=1 Tax=Saccharomonospora amisosensis TaxID=1128677 RepID=A0A7X5ULT8_9PSEU|nr:DUF2249 domain-containing protein [Saccharomonospora amisosensis]NIJ10400.1 uncharacterized protein (DUF2249 family)/iron-sulfur cluster repair protein YtfE (RIC family) [Saccharomonospora amisosensis]
MATTSDVVVASSPQDAEAVEAVEQHHAELAGRLGALTTALVGAAESAEGERFEQAHRSAVRFCTEELLPHAAAEERLLYPAARSHETRLVDGMLAEHKSIKGLVDELSSAEQPVRAAAAIRALRVLFEVHLMKENELLLPVLAQDPAVSLSTVLEGMHELLGGAEHTESAPSDHGHGHGSCGCGESDSGTPELDVRAVPHAIRHATVFGAFDAIGTGGSLVLVAPHDPQPLLRQLNERAAGRIDVEYLERGPQAWRLRLTRT